MPRSACQRGGCTVVIKTRDVLQAQRSLLERTGNLDERPGLLAAEAEGTQRVRVEPCDVASLGESVRARRARGRTAERRGEAVEQLDAKGECELLAGDGVRQAFEQGGEAGRLQAAKALGQRLEVRIAVGRRVEVAEVEIEPKHALQHRRCLGTHDAASQRRVGRDGDGEPRRIGRIDLHHRDVGGDAGYWYCPPVGVAVPPIDRIAGTPPERPDAEVEAKGPQRGDLELGRHALEITGARGHRT